MEVNNAKDEARNRQHQAKSAERQEKFWNRTGNRRLCQNPELCFGHHLPLEKELMRYSTLVFTALLAVLTFFAPTSADAQKAARATDKAPLPAVEILPVDIDVADHLFKADQERGGEVGTYVLGRVTDFAGRSVRGAGITLFSLDSDEVLVVTTNAFGYYRFPGLAEGSSYLIAVHHRKYLFVTGSISFTLEASPVQIDFQAEEAR